MFEHFTVYLEHGSDYVTLTIPTSAGIHKVSEEEIPELFAIVVKDFEEESDREVLGLHYACAYSASEAKTLYEQGDRDDEFISIDGE